MDVARATNVGTEKNKMNKDKGDNNRQSVDKDN
jgi:hypothetical protein